MSLSRRDRKQNRHKARDGMSINAVRHVIINAMLLLVLSGCGFSPLYGDKGAAVNVPLDKIYIANIPDRNGVHLRNALMDRFYHSGRIEEAGSTYILRLTNFREQITDLDITKKADATRAQLKMTANLALQDRRTGATVLQRNIHTITSYNILRSQFTTYVSEQSAREAALNDIARQIERQLSLYFSKTGKTPPNTGMFNSYR